MRLSQPWLLLLLQMLISAISALTVPDAVEAMQRDIRAEETSDQQAPGQGQQPVRAAGAASMAKRRWDPPAHLAEPLRMVWGNYTWERGHRNWIFQQIYANDGDLRYCIKWDSAKTITRTERSQLGKELGVRVQKWVDVLAGYDGWKYPKVPVKVISWAARDKSVLAGLDPPSEGFQFVGNNCDRNCYRYTNRSGKYPKCTGGTAKHHDMVFTAKDTMKGGGSGQDFGQNLNAGDVLTGLKSTNPDRMHIYLHELGHGFGLDDFYSPKNGNNGRVPSRSGKQTRFLMKAGAAIFVTEFDAWMLRQMWSDNAKKQVVRAPAPAAASQLTGTQSRPKR